MTRTALAGLTLAAIMAAGAGGYWAGHRGIATPGSIIPMRNPAEGAAPARPPSGLIVYYRDPDGRPAYSAEPQKTDDGRDFLPVRASEDVSFEDQLPAPAETTAAAAPKKILYYRNPMGLPDTSPMPKKDSMGMDYIPVYAGEGEGGPIVKVAPGKLQRTGVRSEAVSDRAIIRRVRVPGTVQPDERSVSVVAVPADSFVGTVEKVTTGDRVRKGQPLLELRSADIAAAAVQLVINPGYEGSHRRLANLGVPEEVVAEIERTRKVPPAFRWSAPRDGVVLERNATEGMKMSAGEVLFRIADLSTVWVLADVPEYDLASIAPGDSATVRIRSLPGRTFEGRVALIYPQVARETRSTKVRIEIPNPDGLLRPDMYAEVEIAAGTGRLVVAVPDSAVIDSGTRQVVLLDKGEGRFEPREVATGVQGDGYTEIRTGIVSGDRVVVSATFLIDAESNLKAALGGMAKAEETP
ncbi:MAG: efflux transporter periplasmic adaptor subunit [Rhizobiales bacterium 35-68-8]|nr:MAG: efflux transporter periplasmic adaptor subunit [Rhizobiales bacterium 35-68-8]